MGLDDPRRRYIEPGEENELESLFAESVRNGQSEQVFLSALLKRFGISNIPDDHILRSVGHVTIVQMEDLVRRNPKLENFLVLDVDDSEGAQRRTMPSLKWLVGQNWKTSTQPVYSVVDSVSWGALRHVMGSMETVNHMRTGLINGSATFVTSRALNHLFSLRQRGPTGH
jgi:hypothetical protein